MPIPVQVPWVEFSVSPRSGAPVITGLLTATGGAAVMVGVAAELRDAVPSGLTAVMSARMAEPSSATAIV